MRAATLTARLSLLFVSLWILGCGRSSPIQPAAEQALPPLVVALGDSLTAGPGLEPNETYPALLQERARRTGYPHRVVNAGHSGDTSADALGRLESALVPGTSVLVVALGANDGLRGVPIETVRANISAIIETAQDRSVKVLLCGMETPPSHGWGYSLDFHHIFPSLSERYRIPLMPFLLAGVAGDLDANLADGLHPNATGARRIAENMWPYLEPLLR